MLVVLGVLWCTGCCLVIGFVAGVLGIWWFVGIVFMGQVDCTELAFLWFVE